MRDLDYVMIRKCLDNIHDKFMCIIDTDINEYDEDRFGTYLMCHTYLHNAYRSAFDLFECYCDPNLEYKLANRAEFLYRSLCVVCSLEYRVMNKNYFERFIHYIGFVAELNDYMDTGITEKDADRVIYLLIQVYNNQYGKALRKYVYPSDVIKIMTEDQPLFRYIYFNQKR